MWSVEQRKCVSLIFVLFFLFKGNGQDTSILEIPCSTAFDCEHLILAEQNATCSLEKCVCADLYGNEINCKPKVQKLINVIGGHCPCSQPNTECKLGENICYCADGYISSWDRRRCIKRSIELGGSCEHDSQCFITDNYSKCHSEHLRCMCLKNFLAREGSCVSVVGNSETNATCSEDVQCHKYGLDAVCEKGHGQCICANKSISNSNKTLCIPIADYNGNCTEIVQCKNKLGIGAECSSGICTCDDNHYVVVIANSGDRRCERKIPLGHYCVNQSDCHEVNVPDSVQTMECVRGECRCKSGFIFSDFKCNGNDCNQAEFAKISLVLVFLFFFSCR